MERYQITLHSPMGPRRGALELLDGRQAAVTLLGYRSLVETQRLEGGLVCLTGRLNSIMGDIQLDVSLRVENGRFDCLAHTGKGDMRLTGRRVEEQGAD